MAASSLCPAPGRGPGTVCGTHPSITHLPVCGGSIGLVLRGSCFLREAKLSPTWDKLPILRPTGKPSDRPASGDGCPVVEEGSSVEGSLVGVAYGLRQPQSFPTVGSWRARLPAACRFPEDKLWRGISAVLRSPGPWQQHMPLVSLIGGGQPPSRTFPLLLPSPPSGL